MANLVTIQVNDPSGSPINAATVSFAPERVFVPDTVVWPPMFGGQTDLTGKYSRTFLLNKPGVWTYTVTASAPGYVASTASIILANDFNTTQALVLALAPLGETAVGVGVPLLVSVGNPPTIELINLPYTAYSYVETSVASSGGGVVTIETNLSPSGTCSISLRDRFQINPRPTLVAAENTPLQDTAMSTDYTVTCTLISGATRRQIATWPTTALLLNYPVVSELLGKWLPASSLIVTRGHYADASILLPAGSYILRRNAGAAFNPLVDVPFTANGKTITRVRIPAVDTTTLTMWVMQGAGKLSNDLTITYR